jgi:hypothetical protein
MGGVAAKNTGNELLIRNMPPLESIRIARLPEIYQNAKLTISECAKVDECQEWANKAEALASYARQAGDEELRKMADRIQARAIKRCGDLLREIEAGHGARDGKREAGSLRPLNRTQAAKDAGLSEHQQKTAVRVSRVPDEEFQEAVESQDPPTVTALAERGKQSRPKPLVDLQGINPADYQKATQLLGLLSNFRRQSAAIDLDSALIGMKTFEKRDLLEDSIFCMEWIEKLTERIEE